ncbi:hydroxyacylglutathione hydrolase [Chitinivibrio alkaliphilus]|uniref:Hydroxyacylglutathione hydrolase n=1 Tax=Chitinivibrio alkaliphilus ACht1 TaxID=1313304 RepID=U7D951_9BACT|nr:hydroxyacylglutathione hydrolase [Chitinivibrio alkaliphilus]ERP30925.1 metallo-beta-lactamase family protein [Chitinivibrio alkaliphilus ACht1]
MIQTIPLLTDNYAYLISHGPHRYLLDPGEAEPILKLLTEDPQDLSGIILTHYHMDHMGGAATLSQRTHAPVYGPAPAPFSWIHPLHDGETLPLGKNELYFLSLPGHTKTSGAYYSSASASLFTGDTLFSGSCGRIFEGTCEEMFHSMERLKAMPEETRVYFGHEYTRKVLPFARTMEPSNKNIVAYEKTLLSCSTPSTIGREKAINPFFRTDSPEIKEHLSLPGASSKEVFCALRRAKDRW